VDPFPLYVEADEIYNLACPASPIHYQHDPLQTTRHRCMAPAICRVSQRLGAAPSGLDTKSTAIRRSIRRRSPTGATSIPLGLAPATMRQALRGNVVLRTIIGSTALKSSRANLIPTPPQHPADGRVVSNSSSSAHRSDDFGSYRRRNQHDRV